ncbi:DUF3307 domain-containing protein [Streptomyces sp. A1547]|uniref:DUF3307 domain-containing protein n=1 Tax=Streptomyces sp. A1547 TaxID=2563105 RepID=UPI00109E9DFE|nr:DUF3307 domain-containing protein [Streptomyces sp. A1547]THA28473.1 DUF3307 domain-containing protein [Streptomyces sp. A1547]
MFAALFVLLLLGHWAADYPFQTDHQAAHKAECGRTGWTANLAHAATHVLLCGLALALGALLLDDVALTLVPTAGALLWIGATHAFIDRRWPVARWMRFARQEGWAQHGGAAHVDQTAHALALGVAALFLAAI